MSRDGAPDKSQEGTEAGAEAGMDAADGGSRALDVGSLFGHSVDCEEAVHELYVYLDGELTEARREQIRVHLDWCGPCGGAAEFEAELRRVIANRCKDRVPQTLMERVAAALDAESQEHDDGR